MRFGIRLMNRNKMPVWTFFAMAAVTIRVACAVETVVEAKGGNIFLRSGQNAAKQLTTSGRDSAPVLSPDGRWIVFVRALPGKKIRTGVGDTDAAELWQIKSSGEEPSILVAPHEDENMQKVIANFEDVRFSTDGRYVYFVTSAYATSGAVHVVDTTCRKVKFLMPGNGLEVVPSGEYQDCLLVGQHRYFIGGGSYDWIWLFQKDGKEVEPVGEDATNFKDRYDPEIEKKPKDP